MQIPGAHITVLGARTDQPCKNSFSDQLLLCQKYSPVHSNCRISKTWQPWKETPSSIRGCAASSLSSDLAQHHCQQQKLFIQTGLTSQCSWCLVLFSLLKHAKTHIIYSCFCLVLHRGMTACEKHPVFAAPELSVAFVAFYRKRIIGCTCLPSVILFQALLQIVPKKIWFSSKVP